jgi:AraC-like DNA-binding protein
VTADSGFWLVNAPGPVARVEACFAGAAYAPHRHDSYAIGITLTGVQRFDYRGVTRNSLPGGLVILHPDELHDGRAGDERAFRYRTAYVAPADILGMLDGRPLPFVEGGVSTSPRLRDAVLALLGDMDRPLAGLELEDALYDLAMALEQTAATVVAAPVANREAAARARDYIEARIDRHFSLADLEAATGHGRWQLSRDFRAMFGTSPYRYLLMRRLDRARDMMVAGLSLAETAHDSGFADQSHFSRMFKRAFGLTPDAWRRGRRHPHDRSRPGAPIPPDRGRG